MPISRMMGGVCRMLCLCLKMKGRALFQLSREGGDCGIRARDDELYEWNRMIWVGV